MRIYRDGTPDYQRENRKLSICIEMKDIEIQALKQKLKELMANNDYQ